MKDLSVSRNTAVLHKLLNPIIVLQSGMKKTMALRLVLCFLSSYSPSFFMKRLFWVAGMILSTSHLPSKVFLNPAIPHPYTKKWSVIS